MLLGLAFTIMCVSVLVVCSRVIGVNVGFTNIRTVLPCLCLSGSIGLARFKTKADQDGSKIEPACEAVLFS